MKPNPDAYRRTVVPQIESWFKTRPNCTPHLEVGKIAIATGCPIEVVAQFVEELLGETPELSQLKAKLAAFYK